MSSSGEQVLSLCFRQRLLGDFPFSPAIWAAQHGCPCVVLLYLSLMLAAIFLWHHIGPWTLWHNHRESVFSSAHTRILRWQKQITLWWLKQKPSRGGHTAKNREKSNGPGNKQVFESPQGGSFGEIVWLPSFKLWHVAVRFFTRDME